MPEWFDGVAQEWSLIGAAPISFAIALVVVIIVVWAILHWFHRRMLSSKDIRIEVLQSRLADYRNVLEGASPREAAYKITQLKGKLEAIKGMPRDENTIYQKGKRIAEVVGIRIDPANNSVVFDRMRIAGHLDQATHVEFKNLVLAFVGLDGFSQTRHRRQSQRLESSARLWFNRSPTSFSCQSQRASGGTGERGSPGTGPSTEKIQSTTDAGSLNTFGRNEIEVAPISSALLRIACLVILYKT
jgi:hypothetical protein